VAEIKRLAIFSELSVMTAPPGPLQTRLELAALATAPGAVRRHVRSVARGWGLADLAGTAELLASEIVTNAVQASALVRTEGPPVIRVRITSDGVSMVVHVWDACPQMPVARQADIDDNGGRGLMLVQELSKDWGSYPKAGGKVVWVLVCGDA
jgi:anti-sigma regulatory factor (Ser/Thr protein kinase)